MNREEADKIVKDLMKEISAVVYSRRVAVSALRLLFLKYAVDNYIGAGTVEETKMCADILRLFASRNVEDGVGVIVPYLQVIDRSYGLKEILSGQETVEAYEEELFGYRHGRYKAGTSERSFEHLIATVGKYDLKEDEGRTVGRMLASSILDAVDEDTAGSMSGYGNLIGRMLGAIAAALLEIRETDIFLDPACGYSTSSLRIVKDGHVQVVMVDEDNLSASAAAMCLILSGHRDIRIFCEDAITRPIPDVCGTRIFAVFPAKTKVRQTDDNPYSEASLAGIHRIMTDYLKENGRAVIIVPSGMLFVGRGQHRTLRDDMISAGLLKAVVELPQLMPQTASRFSLLLLSKEESIEDSIVMIDASKLMNLERSEEAYAEKLIAQWAKKVLTAIRMKQDEAGYATVVEPERIREGGYNLTPGTYILSQRQGPDMTLREVDVRLKKLYEKLIEMQTEK